MQGSSVMGGLGVFEYLSVLWRRKVLFLLVFGVIFLPSLIYALKWSNYSTFAVVEVVQPTVDVDTGSVSGVDTGRKRETMADLRISRLQQRVLSVNSLIDIITKLDLYPEMRKHTPLAYVAKKMRKDVKIELVSTSLANPASAHKVSALQLSAIAFRLSFEYNDPLLTQQAVNELVSRFLDEDLKERRETARRTSEFLEGQIEVIEKSLAEQEKKIAEFRAVNGDIRPDALAFNQQAAASMVASLQSVESKIIANIGRQGALRSQLAKTDPYSRVVEDGQVLTTPSIQLRALKSEYATLRAKYGAEHPDVLKVSRQIDVLEAQVSPESYVARIRANIDDLKTRLGVARGAYGDDHPSVLSLEKQLRELKSKLAKADKDAGNSEYEIKEDADNPAYLEIVAELRSVEEQLNALKAQKEEMEKQKEKYQKAILNNPSVEQELAALTRDYDNYRALYRELKARKMAADMSEAIEEGHNGQRFSVINPPELPLGTQPSRKVLMLAGFVLATMGGLASVFGWHVLGNSIIGPHHLESIIGVAPLVVIPHIYTLDEKIRRRKILRKVLAILPVLAVIGLVLVSFFVMPLDVLWSVLMQRLGL